MNWSWPKHKYVNKDMANLEARMTRKRMKNNKLHHAGLKHDKKFCEYCNGVIDRMV